MMFTQEAQLEENTDAVQLTGLLSNQVARSYMHNLCVIIIVVVLFILDIVLVGFLEISYYIPSITCEDMAAYEREHLSNILGYEFEYCNKQMQNVCDTGSFFSAGLISWIKGEVKHHRS
jgi:hypothetical protein